LANNYIWDRCIEELRKLLPKVYRIEYQQMQWLRKRGTYVWYPEQDAYNTVKDKYTNEPIYDEVIIGHPFWWTVVNWRSFIEKYTTAWYWHIYAARIYLTYSTQLLSEYIVTRSWLYVYTRSINSDWTPHKIEIYHAEWNPDNYPSWDIYKSGVLLFQVDVNNLQEGGFNKLEVDTNIINTSGLTQFTILNTQTKDPHLNNTWPPNPYYQSYKQEIYFTQQNYFLPYLLVYCYD